MDFRAQSAFGAPNALLRNFQGLAYIIVVLPFSVTPTIGANTFSPHRRRYLYSIQSHILQLFDGSVVVLQAVTDFCSAAGSAEYPSRRLMSCVT